MKVHLLAVGQRMPAWVEQGYNEYAARLSGNVQLQLKEIAATKRTRNSVVDQLKQQEGQRLTAAIPDGSRVIALDEHGKNISTKQFADKMQDWLQLNQDVSLLVGGPDGLSADCLSRADERWSLSPLTFPHPLVRIIIAEQVYRAWSIINNHPYHRA